MPVQLEIRWANPAAKEYFDTLLAQIAEAYRVPDYLLGGPAQALYEFQRSRLLATAALNKLAAEIHAECTTAVVHVSKQPQSE